MSNTIFYFITILRSLFDFDINNFWHSIIFYINWVEIRNLECNINIVIDNLSWNFDWILMSRFATNDVLPRRDLVHHWVRFFFFFFLFLFFQLFSQLLYNFGLADKIECLFSWKRSFDIVHNLLLQFISFRSFVHASLEVLLESLLADDIVLLSSKNSNKRPQEGFHFLWEGSHFLFKFNFISLIIGDQLFDELFAFYKLFIYN